MNNIVRGLLFLIAAAACIYFAGQIFTSAENIKTQALKYCWDEAKNLESIDKLETLSYAGSCVEASKTGTAGAWVLIVIGGILGFFGIVSFVTKKE